MDLQTLQDKYRDEILSITSQHGASHIRIFGSVARGDASENSDIDFLIDLDKERSLMDLARINVALEDLLHTKVDLVVASNIKPALKNIIFKEATDL